MAWWLAKPATIGLCLLLVFVIGGSGIYYAISQTQKQRETFCVAIQPYNQAVRDGAFQATQAPPPQPSTVKLREGFEQMEKRLHCSPDPYDGK